MTQKIKRVRVTKANSWYADKVGQEFFVTESQWTDSSYPVILTGYHDESPVPRCLAAGDFEILEEFDGRVVEQVVVAIVRDGR